MQGPIGIKYSKADLFGTLIRGGAGLDVPIKDMEPMVASIGGAIDYRSDMPDLRHIKLQKTGERAFVLLANAGLKERAGLNFLIAEAIASLFSIGFPCSGTFKESSIGTCFNVQGSAVNSVVAASILMPMEIFEDKVLEHTKAREDGTKVVNIDKVASFFFVSTDTAMRWGVELGLIKPYPLL